MHKSALVLSLIPTLLINTAFASNSATDISTNSMVEMGTATRYRSIGAKVTDSVMNPHAPPAKGPWFEGWYLRMSDQSGKRSIAVIVASTLSGSSPLREMSRIPGYVAVLESEGDNAPTLSYEAFPSESEITFAGRPVDASTTVRGPVSFEWRAQGFGYVTEKEINLEIPGRIRVEANLVGARKPWSSLDTDFGPQGIGALFTFLPLHWYVHNRSTETEYKVTHLENGKNDVIEGRAWTHQEKNFGQAFPKAWMWMQGTSTDGEAHIALAGGQLDMGRVQMTTYMIGYKSPAVEAAFRPGEIETAFYPVIEPCTGRFRMRALNLDYELLIDAQAEPKSFGAISIPTRDGYVQNGGRESFSTRIVVEVYRNDWLGTMLVDRLVERRVFENGALEFGAAYQECNAKNKARMKSRLKIHPGVGVTNAR